MSTRAKIDKRLPWLTLFRRRDSFNLVELSLAVAVVAVGVISVFGILPHLLKSSRQAVEYSAISMQVQNIVDDPSHRGYITYANITNTALFPTITAPLRTNYSDGSFNCIQELSSWASTNADVALTGGKSLYTNRNGKPSLKTLFIKYRWGNTNSATDENSFIFVTETAVTQDFMGP